MSILNENWDRWIRASVAKALKASCVAAVPPIPFFVEGGERLTNMVPAAIELRMLGPNWEGLVQDQWLGTFEVNVICECIESADLYASNKMTGLVSKAMAASFKVFKLGDQPGDDPTILVACTNQVGPIKVRPYGFISASVRLMQATVSAKYTVILP